MHTVSTTNTFLWLPLPDCHHSFPALQYQHITTIGTLWANPCPLIVFAATWNTHPAPLLDALRTSFKHTGGQPCGFDRLVLGMEKDARTIFQSGGAVEGCTRALCIHLGQMDRLLFTLTPFRSGYPQLSSKYHMMYLYCRITMQKELRESELPFVLKSQCVVEGWESDMRSCPGIYVSV